MGPATTGTRARTMANRRPSIRTAALRAAAATAVVTSFNPVRAQEHASQKVENAGRETDDLYEVVPSTVDDDEQAGRLGRKTFLNQIYAWLPIQIVAAVYLGLSFVERPAWCYHATCASPDGLTVPMSGMPLLPTFASGCVDLACYAAFLIELVVAWSSRGRGAFCGSLWHNARLAVLLVGVADSCFDLLAIAHIFGLTTDRTWRLAPIMRPVICTMGNKSLRRRVLLTAEVLWDIKEMLLLLAFLVVWFGAVMFALFRKFCKPPECNESAYYGTVPRSLLSSFTTITTANFPDVYMEAYGYHRLFALPFIAFASFGIFLALNLIFASVYASHKHRMETRANEDMPIQEDSLDRAFQLLLADVQSAEGAAVRTRPLSRTTESLPVDVFEQFVRIYSAQQSTITRSFSRAVPLRVCQIHLMYIYTCLYGPGTLDWHGRQLNEAVVGHIVQMVDANGDDSIDRDEFRQLCRQLPAAVDTAYKQEALYTMERASPLLRVADSAVRYENDGDDRRNARSETVGGDTSELPNARLIRRQLRRTMRDRDMEIERCMIVVIIANTCTIMYEVVHVDEVEGGWQKTAIPTVELGFTLIYVLEMVVKVSTWSWPIYWSRFRNKFDGVITIITVAGEIVLHLPQSMIHDNIAGQGYGLTRLFTLLRALRVLRVLTDIGEFSLIFQSISELAPVFSRLGSMLLVVMLFFAQLGMFLFGGQIYEGNSALRNSSFDALHYYPNNFNDLGSGLVVLFDFLVVNNWTVTLEGMSLTSRRPWAAYAYFLCYYIVVVVVIVNLLVAYVVDRYHEQHRLDRLLEQLFSTVAEDEKIIEDVCHWFEHFATTIDYAASEEAPEVQKPPKQEQEQREEQEQEQRLPTQELPLEQVPEVLKALNSSPKQVLQLNTSALGTFALVAATVAGDRGVLCFEEFMDVMVETLKTQYQTEQMAISQMNRTL